MSQEEGWHWWQRDRLGGCGGLGGWLTLLPRPPHCLSPGSDRRKAVGSTVEGPGGPGPRDQEGRRGDQEGRLSAPRSPCPSPSPLGLVR